MSTLNISTPLAFTRVQLRFSVELYQMAKVVSFRLYPLSVQGQEDIEFQRSFPKELQKKRTCYSSLFLDVFIYKDLLV